MISLFFSISASQFCPSYVAVVSPFTVSLVMQYGATPKQNKKNFFSHVQFLCGIF